MTDTHTDGNESAGVLGRLLAVEVTTVRRRCQSCHAEHPLAEHRAYHGAAVVLRCPACDDIAVRVAERDDDVVVEWRGTYRIAG